ncbi:hypothetical protein TELCIR_10113 [Teladorsagia circumcincta]|uniref:Unspecific monooxygenase n=1 Tax=Teladorsagia circumcincta TaxID=45464 RepID=A0A2G9UEF4_TELCI|nr:hypothetical protein TELCIR_10113 [Teladorsagia circumcincta]
MFAVVVLFLLSFVVYYVWLFYANVKRYPKGPTPLPVVGNLLLLFNFETVKAVSEATEDKLALWPDLIGDDFNGRSGLFPDTLYQSMHNGGIVFSQGDLWREQRRVSLQILRDFGMGKSAMEEQVSLSAQEFLNHMNSIKNKDEVDPRRPLQEQQDGISSSTYAFHTQDSSATQYSRWKITQSVREDVKKALQSWDDKQEPECFVHAYCQQMKTNPLLSYDNLINVCSDLFLAGMETTATTLRWGSLILAKHADIQEKIRSEILSVVDRNEKPSMSLKQRLPYTK